MNRAHFSIATNLKNSQRKWPPANAALPPCLTNAQPFLPTADYFWASRQSCRFHEAAAGKYSLLTAVAIYLIAVDAAAAMREFTQHVASQPRNYLRN